MKVYTSTVTRAPRIPFTPSVLLGGLVLIMASTACSPVPTPEPVIQTASATVARILATPALPASSTPTSPPPPTATPALTLTPTESPTVTITPTYAILRGEVLVRSNCRYGPGAPYLYKYGLVVGSHLEIIGRNDLGTWILVRAIGGNNPCWVKASLMDIGGDVMSVAPTYIPLPRSPYYGPLKGVSAIRNGDEVTIFWSVVQLRAGDETASPPYLVEAWVCQGGRIIFIPLGSYAAAVKVIDEEGCLEPSHGRALLAEKHGYTRPVEVPWPAQPSP